MRFDKNVARLVFLIDLSVERAEELCVRPLYILTLDGTEPPFHVSPGDEVTREKKSAACRRSAILGVPFQPRTGGWVCKWMTAAY